MNKAVTKYASDLISGMRSSGFSIIECCLLWGITDTEYNKLLENNPELIRAHEIGEMHCAAWWHASYRKFASKGNASALAFGMKNIDKVGWQDKPDSAEAAVEPVRSIQITVLPPRKGED